MSTATASAAQALNQLDQGTVNPMKGLNPGRCHYRGASRAGGPPAAHRFIQTAAGARPPCDDNFWARLSLISFFSSGGAARQWLFIGQALKAIFLEIII